jgi:hypothetical protein
MSVIDEQENQYGTTLCVKETYNDAVFYTYINYNKKKLLAKNIMNEIELEECIRTIRFIKDYMSVLKKDNYMYEEEYIIIEEEFPDVYKRIKTEKAEHENVIGLQTSNPGFLQFYLKQYKYVCNKSNYEYTIYNWIQMMTTYQEEFKKDMETPNLIYQFGEAYTQYHNRFQDFNGMNNYVSNYKFVNQRVYNDIIDVIIKDKEEYKKRVSSGGQKLSEIAERLVFPIEPVDENLPHKEYTTYKKSSKWKEHIARALDKAGEYGYCTKDLTEYTKKLIQIKDVSNIEQIGEVIEWVYMPKLCPFANEDGTTENDEMPNYKKRDF